MHAADVVDALVSLLPRAVIPLAELGLSQAVVRGAMLLRLTGFLGGYAGVTADLCRFLADRLNDGWYPVVPSGVSGAAGEIVPLAHLFGFKPLPLTFLAILALMIATYLALAQIGVGLFFKPQGGRPLARAISAAERRITRRASRWGSWRHRNHPPTPQLTP